MKKLNCFVIESQDIQYLGKQIIDSMKKINNQHLTVSGKKTPAFHRLLGMLDCLYFMGIQYTEFKHLINTQTKTIIKFDGIEIGGVTFKLEEESK